MNLKILGTSHIARQSIEELKRIVTEYQPEIIALELDQERASVLLEGERRSKRPSLLQQVRSFGLKGYLFARLGHYIQQKLGQSVGVSPGSEMKTALEIARKQNLQIALIDQPIHLTLQKFSKGFTWRERGRFASDIFFGLIQPQKQMKKWKISQFDLRSVPPEEILREMIEHLKERYPSLHKTLIEDRNKYMVRKLVQLVRGNKDKKILVVVGAGHQKGMEELLLKVEIV
ncbi:TraB/GumN family protein [Candidatus Woesearchaeota archaeon]|nr:TraB/GumN family protein [Candidatus Woesearchaeota archaeon]